MSDLTKSMHIAASGMRVQGQRIRVITENVANAQSAAGAPGEDPYRRKVLTFDSVLDRKIGADVVTVKSVDRDRSDFKRLHKPGHPAAGEDGYVLMPNVNTIMEMTDMREAQRSYEANLQSIQASKTMLYNTLDILR